MKQKTDRRYGGSKRLLSLFLMSVLSVALVLASGWIYGRVRASYLTPTQDVSMSVAGVRALSLTEQEKLGFHVDSAAYVLDAQGRQVGFMVVTTTRGYKSDIRVQSAFTADSETLVGIRVLEQDETEYLGTRIQTEEFVSLFAGRRAPMKLWGTATLGSPIDALSGSTVSSQAVVDAVNALLAE